MNIAKIITTALLLLFVISTNGYTQNNYNCPDNASNPENESYAKLERFLTSDDHETHRTIINLKNLQNSPIDTLTSSSYSCYKLNNYISQHTSLDTNEYYTFYKVNNYYFIVTWFSVNTTKPRGILIFDNNYDLYGYASL